MAAPSAPFGQAYFAALYTRHDARLRGFFYAQLHDAHAAEDLAHDVLTAALGRARSASAIEPWLWGVARKKLLKELARRKRLAFIDPLALLEQLEAASEREVGEQVGWIAYPELRPHLRRLNRYQQQVVVLAALADLDDREIARQLGRSVASVAKTKSQAHGLLRARLVAREESPGGWSCATLAACRRRREPRPQRSFTVLPRVAARATLEPAWAAGRRGF